MYALMEKTVSDVHAAGNGCNLTGNIFGSLKGGCLKPFGFAGRSRSPRKARRY